MVGDAHPTCLRSIARDPLALDMLIMEEWVDDALGRKKTKVLVEVYKCYQFSD